MSHSEHAYTKSTLDSHRHRRSTRPITLCAIAAGLAVASVTGTPTASALVDFRVTALNNGHGDLLFEGENTDGEDVLCVFYVAMAQRKPWLHYFPNGPINETHAAVSELYMPKIPSQVDMTWKCQDSAHSTGSASVYVT